jgi:hypothetical protein
MTGHWAKTDTDSRAVTLIRTNFFSLCFMMNASLIIMLLFELLVNRATIGLTIWQASPILQDKLEKGYVYKTVRR